VVIRDQFLIHKQLNSARIVQKQLGGGGGGGVERRRRSGSRIEARALYVGLGGDPPRSLCERGQCPLLQHFKFLILKRRIFVDCLALKFIFIAKMPK